MKRLAFLISLTTIVYLLAACTAPMPEIAEITVTEEVEKGGDVVIAMNNEPDMLDPNVGSSRYDEQVLVNIFNLPVYRDADLNFVPGLVEDWEVDDTGTTWTLQLRDGVTFHDGTSFNAEALKFNFNRIKDPNTKSRKAAGLLGSPESTVVDEYTLQVKYEEPMPAFLDAMSSPMLGVVSPASVEQYGEDVGRHPVGTGPFKFVEWVSQDHITLERSSDYDWAPPHLKHQGPAYLDTLSFRFIPEDLARSVALQTGEVDAIINMPRQEVVRFSTDPDFVVRRAVVAGTPIMIMINGTRAPTDEPAVRQALEHALNREELTRLALFNVGYEAYTPLSPANPCYDQSIGDLYSYDPEQARQLLEEGGWTDTDGDGIRDKDGQPLSLVYITFPTPAYRMRTAEQFQAQFRDIGVDMQIQPMAAPQIQTARQAGDHHLAFLNWLGMDPAILDVLYHSRNIGSGWNFTHFPSDELDSRLEQADAEIDPEQRCTLYEEAQRIIMEQAIMIPVVLQEMIVGHNASIKDLSMMPHGEYIQWYDAYKE